MTYLLTLLTKKVSQIPGFDLAMKKKSPVLFFPTPPFLGPAAGLAGSLPREMKAVIVHESRWPWVHPCGFSHLQNGSPSAATDRPLQCH